MTDSQNPTPAQPASGTAPGTVIKMQLPPLGLPGNTVQLVTVGISKTNPDAERNKALPSGSPGEYNVLFVLSRPGYALEPEYRYSFPDLVEGNSHLAITKPAFVHPSGEFDQIQIDGASPDGTFRFTGLPNKRGYLAKIQSESFLAQRYSDAEQKAYRALLPALSSWSAELDIPLNIWQIQSTEVKTGNKQVSFVPAYPEVPWNVLPKTNLEPEFLGYASIYREALNSNSPIYRYLCLYKIIEGIRFRRARLASAAKARGEHPRKFQWEEVPSTPQELIAWLNAIFTIRPAWEPLTIQQVSLPEAQGKSFGHLADKHLTPLRDKIAHALYKGSGELTLSSDELLHMREVNHWLPITKCIVRRLLKNEFPTQYLSYLKEDGTIAS